MTEHINSVDLLAELRIPSQLFQTRLVLNEGHIVLTHRPILFYHFDVLVSIDIVFPRLHVAFDILLPIMNWSRTPDQSHSSANFASQLLNSRGWSSRRINDHPSSQLPASQQASTWTRNSFYEPSTTTNPSFTQYGVYGEDYELDAYGM